ncbi:MAG: hypothetical protein COB53_08915 [Elusimicrobia bacterium]|nr:MAG: hypothetical protein COB53_08915 [Elusimicrobiota bacterium]
MKTAIGWIVLIGALAIPAVLFWKWWIAMQTTTTLEIKQKPPVEQTAAFGDIKSAQENPIATSPVEPQPQETQRAAALQAGNDDGSLDEAPDMAVAPVAEQPQPEGEGSGGGSAASPGAVGSEQPQETLLAKTTQERVPGAVGTGGTGRVRYLPKTSRDPMISILDLRELAKRRLAKELARRQIKRALEKPKKKPEPKKVVIRKPPPPKPRRKPFCETVELQGIIATPNGIAAIIDDEVHHEGDRIKGAVIARITTRTVIFKRRRRTVCVKRVEQ